MASGIYRIVNTYNNEVMYTYASDNLEETIKDFDDGIMPSRRLSRYKYKKDLKIEIVEETESLAERYAFYRWPQLDRVSYSEECIRNSLDDKFTTKINNVIDWLVEVFPEEDYNIELYIEEGELKGNVYRNGIRIEKYTFNNKKGEPTAREFTV